LREFILLESGHGRRLIFRQIALRIDRALSALGRGERQVDASIFENEMGAANSSSRKPVFRPVFPSWLCDVSTITIFIVRLLLLQN
jgi:hypothetical protein